VPPTLSDRLIHILEAIDRIRSSLSATDQKRFAEDFFQRMAIERLFEIISEASRWIPADLKEGEKKIDWRRMADLGNQLRHAYHRVSPDLLWTIAERDLPPLKIFIERIIQNSKQ
jgi:uncharacterized protein with HEPN domain